MLNKMTNKYPTKKSLLYTAQKNLKMEPELKTALEDLQRQCQEDVPEAIRIKLRELVKELGGSLEVAS